MRMNSLERMNRLNYKQYDTRWDYMPYPTRRWNIGNSGCGEVSICNIIIEMNKWLNDTPKTIQPYCVQYAAPNGDGTYWSGIPAMMKHYGFTEVKEHDTMQQLFRELAKGDRVAVYLMGSASAGSKRVHWTSGGHFVSSVLYKKESGEDWVYMKDPNSTSSLRNGWITYNGNIRGACLKVWSGKLDGTSPQPTGKLDVDGIGGYNTAKRLQEFFKVEPSGVLYDQNKSLYQCYCAWKSVTFGTGGCEVIWKLQKWLGYERKKCTGIWDEKTSVELQRKLIAEGYLSKGEDDGIFYKKSMKALQRFLNDQLK